MGELGVRSACMLAPFAFLASAAAALPLQEAILPAYLAGDDDSAVSNTKTAWTSQANKSKPSDAVKHIQCAWDADITMAVYNSLLQTCSSGTTEGASDSTRRRLASCSASHFYRSEIVRRSNPRGNWLSPCHEHMPTTHLRLRVKIDARGLHGLVCRKSAPRHVRHSQLNDVVWRAVKKTQTPATKEPVRLTRADGKRLDGATLVSWTRGKPLAWDVTYPYTYATSHISSTSVSACAAAEKSAANKTRMYATITSTHLFVPIAVETSGAWCSESAEFIEDLGRRITVITGEPLETTYLFQRISVT